MNAIVGGVRLGVARLSSIRSTAAFALALAAVLIGALIERRMSSLLAADRALLGIVFGVVVPLIAWGALARVTAGRRLEESVREIARHGANRRLATLGVVLLAGVVVAFASVLLTLLAVLATRFPSDPRLLSDLVTSGWIALVAGAAYAAWFALGSTLGRSGGGRGWLLVIDWLLGAGVGVLALPWPRAHAANLLGAAPVLGMPQWAATASLVVLGLSYAALSVLRSRP